MIYCVREENLCFSFFLWFTVLWKKRKKCKRLSAVFNFFQPLDFLRIKILFSSSSQRPLKKKLLQTCIRVKGTLPCLSQYVSIPKTNIKHHKLSVPTAAVLLKTDLKREKRGGHAFRSAPRLRVMITLWTVISVCWTQHNEGRGGICFPCSIPKTNNEKNIIVVLWTFISY